MCIISLSQNNFYSNQNQLFSRFSGFENSFFDQPKRLRMDAEVMPITLVKSNQAGKIINLGKEHGFVDYKLDDESLNKTLTKNGATSIPSNDKLFFHKSQLSGPISEYKIGQTITFDIMHNKRSNKLICYNIYAQNLPKMTEIGHFQKMSVSKLTETSNPPPKMQYISTKIAKITNLQKNYGTLDNEIFFHADNLILTRFNELSIGDDLSFTLYKNTKTDKFVAKNLLATGNNYSKNANIRQLMSNIETQQTKLIQTSLTKSINLISKSTIGKVVQIEKDYGYIKTNTDMVYFEKFQLIQLTLKEAENATVQFDMYKNVKTGKFIAKNVEIANTQDSTLKAAEIGHFQKVEISSMVPKVTDRILIEKSKIGKIVNLFKDYGHVEYKNEKFFFHKSGLILATMSELKNGVKVSFDLVKIVKTDKIIAKNVEIVDNFNINQIGHFQKMEPSVLVSKASPLKLQPVKTKITGKIRSLGKDYGYVEKYYFNKADLVLIDFASLKIDTMVKFDVYLNTKNEKLIAKNVEILEKPDTAFDMSKIYKAIEARVGEQIKLKVPEPRLTRSRRGSRAALIKADFMKLNLNR